MKYKKIYILTPPAVVTGGPEALFQLSDSINSQGGYGINLFSSYHENPVPEEYKKYKTNYEGEQIENSSENLVIFPEIWAGFVDDVNYNQINKAIWWLSVDNGWNRERVNFQTDTIHLYQSYYAEDFLNKKSAKNMLPLFDYLSENYLEEHQFPQKKNRICYSIKGQNIANQLRMYLSNYEFVMIAGMSRLEVIETLKESKVFIDFGHHPGKDRIPREAAMLKNCVITNRKGAANFSKDVPILEKYKIENDDISKMIELIVDCVENYKDKISDFEDYRLNIIGQKEEFFKQVKNLIS